MKILVHDFAGHPFQMGLSQSLAKRGHTVVHAFFAGDPGPKGQMQAQTFRSGGSVNLLPLGRTAGYEKSNYAMRLLRDLEYRLVISKHIRSTEYDMVLSGNTPLWIQGALLSAAKHSGAGFVFWCQDFYSIAVADFLKAKFGLVAEALALCLLYWDKLQFKKSQHIVHITEKFAEQTDEFGICRDKVSVIPNWGALRDIDVFDYINMWSIEQGLGRKPVVLYSGTLGVKHNPDLIKNAATSIDCDFVVSGFGAGYDRLRGCGLVNLKLLPLQDFEVFPKVLGAATVLIAVIEREAGNFSVPSKVLSYLCAGRPIVLAAPADNLASSIIRESGAGLVVEPEDSQGFTEAIGRIIDDPELAKSMGKAGRRYAEENFDIDIVTSRFEEVFERALGRVK